MIFKCTPPIVGGAVTAVAQTAHAFAALDQMTLTEHDQVIICLSGRGDKDLATYMRELNLDQA